MDFVVIKPYRFMGLYKLSSQFTDFVKARSANPTKILEQVSDAIEDLGDKGIPVPGGSAALEAFHSFNPGGEDVDDQFMIEHLGGENAIPLLNKMYKILGELTTTGKLDMVTRKVIETFLRSWQPYPEPARATGVGSVIRRKKPEVEVVKEEVQLPEMEARNRWSGPEDRMLDRLDRDRARERVASLYEMFAKAGVLERLPDFEERKIRLAERSFEWAKIVQ